MTTTFFLTRHAAHDRLGRVLTGRVAGITLGEAGRAQARRLAEHFAGRDVAAVYTSPLERARETAEPIAERLGLEARMCEPIAEIDFGAWTGRSFADLAGDPLWERWNSLRSLGRPPGGESMIEVQARIVAGIEQMRGEHRGAGAVLVSHGDVIKAALAYHLGLPLDLVARIEISPASVSTLVVGDWGTKVIAMNEVVAA